MAYKDGEDFTTYCDKPYDRHIYKVVFKDGSSVIIEEYDLVKYQWYQWKDKASHVEILDVKKKRGGVGF